MRLGTLLVKCSGTAVRSMAGVQLDLLGNSNNKGGRGDKGGDNNQQSNEIAKSLIPPLPARFAWLLR